MTTPAPLETEQAALLPCLCAQTRRVDRLLNRIYDDALRPLGINTMQKSMLTIIGRFPTGLDTADLCQRLALDRSTLTRNLTTLEQMGLVSTTGESSRSPQTHRDADGRGSRHRGRLGTTLERCATPGSGNAWIRTRG